MTSPTENLKSKTFHISTF